MAHILPPQPPWDVHRRSSGGTSFHGGRSRRRPMNLLCHLSCEGDKNDRRSSSSAVPRHAWVEIVSISTRAFSMSWDRPLSKVERKRIPLLPWKTIPLPFPLLCPTRRRDPFRQLKLPTNARQSNLITLVMNQMMIAWKSLLLSLILALERLFWCWRHGGGGVCVFL